MLNKIFNKIKIQCLALTLGVLCLLCFLFTDIWISSYLLKLISYLPSLEFRKIIGAVVLLMNDSLVLVIISIFLTIIFANKLFEKFLLNSLLMTLGAFISDMSYCTVIQTQYFDITYFQTLKLFSVNKITSILIMAIVITLNFMVAIYLSMKIRNKYFLFGVGKE